MLLGAATCAGCGGSSTNSSSQSAPQVTSQLLLFAPVDAPVAGQPTTVSAQMFIQNPPAPCGDSFSLDSTQTCTPAPVAVQFEVTSAECAPYPCDLAKTETFGNDVDVYYSTVITLVPTALPTTLRVQAQESGSTPRTASQSVVLGAQ